MPLKISPNEGLRRLKEARDILGDESCDNVAIDTALRVHREAFDNMNNAIDAAIAKSLKKQPD
jgi:hypothetical protein